MNGVVIRGVDDRGNGDGDGMKRTETSPVMPELPPVRQRMCWRRSSGDSWLIHRAGKVLGMVFKVSKGWHWKTFDGRDTNLSRDLPMATDEAARRACRDHLRMLERMRAL